MQLVIFALVFLLKPNMQTKFLLFLLGTVLMLVASCDPTTYISSAHNFEDKWTVNEVVAPSYPIDDKHEKNDISISFPKQGEFLLHLSVNSCRGTYEADTNGYIRITGTSCTEQCCQTDWDYYILTLIRKATSYKGGEGLPLYLYIDKKNYIILEVEYRQ